MKTIFNPVKTYIEDDNNFIEYEIPETLRPFIKNSLLEMCKGMGTYPGGISFKEGSISMNNLTCEINLKSSNASQSGSITIKDKKLLVFRIFIDHIDSIETAKDIIETTLKYLTEESIYRMEIKKQKEDFKNKFKKESESWIITFDTDAEK